MKPRTVSEVLVVVFKELPAFERRRRPFRVDAYQYQPDAPH
jgi:hypothetical protein